MGSVQIDPGLDPDRRIFRRVSFYDLVDLVRFSQIFLPGVAAPRSEPVACQAWTMYEDAGLADCGGDGGDAPGVCLVSSARALSDALATDDATRILIEPASDDALHVLAWSRRPGGAFFSEGGMRLLVDLRVLLAGVIVSRDAPGRFLDLVCSVVQDRIWVSVERAAPPAIRLAGEAREPAVQRR